MILVLGLLSNVYISYLIIGFKYGKINTIKEPYTTKGGENYKSSFEIICRITSLIVLIYLLWVFFIYLFIPTIGPATGINLILLDGLCKINQLLLISEIFLIICVFIILQFINTNNKGKQTGPPELFLMILTNMIGLIYLFNSNDWVITITAWELMNLSLYLLVTIRGESPSNRRNFEGSPFMEEESIKGADVALSAGMKYFLLSALTTSFFLMGVSLIYGKMGSTNYEIISILSMQLSYNINNLESIIIHQPALSALLSEDFILFIGLLLISITLMFKLGAAPFHNWAPDLYDSIPTPITIYIAIIPKIAILIFMLVAPIVILSSIRDSVTSLINIVGIISIIIGSLGLSSQWRIKRFITYSAISHLGFILLAYVSLSLDSYLFYIFIYSITTIIFFAILLIISADFPSITIQKTYNPNVEYIESPIYSTFNEDVNINSEFYVNSGTCELKDNDDNLPIVEVLQDEGDTSSTFPGIFSLNPFLAFSLAICLFSLAGIPPLAGFYTKLEVIKTLIFNINVIIVFVIIIASIISTVNYLTLVTTCLLEKPKINGNISVTNINSNLLSILIFILLIVIIKYEIILDSLIMILLIFQHNKLYF